jgi:hypothetical protein
MLSFRLWREFSWFRSGENFVFFSGVPPVTFIIGFM